MLNTIKGFSVVSFLLISVGFGSCSNLQDKNLNISVQEFDTALRKNPSAQLVDVRTPGEFSGGHLQNAVNIDWNGENFENKISALDKSKPVYVYCLSGGRSSSAANKMIHLGFNEVYNMEGGIMKWKAAGFPEITASGLASKGIPLEKFNELLNTDKLVLVDFYAQWCAPCKKMAPYLREIESEMAATVMVKRIDVEENSSLARELGVDVLPTLFLYKNKQIVWRNTGYIEKDAVVHKLK